MYPLTIHPWDLNTKPEQWSVLNEATMGYTASDSSGARDALVPCPWSLSLVMLCPDAMLGPSDATHHAATALTLFVE
jgi:hypothetical protein